MEWAKAGEGIRVMTVSLVVTIGPHLFMDLHYPPFWRGGERVNISTGMIPALVHPLLVLIHLLHLGRGCYRRKRPPMVAPEPGGGLYPSN